MNHRTALSILLAVAAWAASAALETSDSAEQQINLLRRQVDDADAAYRRSSAPPESEQSWKRYSGLSQTNLPKIIRLARQEPASSAATATFIWIATNAAADSPKLWTNVLQSLDLLREYHAADTNLGAICFHAAIYWDWRWHERPLVDFLKAVSDKNSNRAVRGEATFALARLAKDKADTLAFQQNAPRAALAHQGVQQIAQNKFLAAENNHGLKAVSQDAENLLHTVISQYGDCNDSRGPGPKPPRKLGEEAKSELFEIRHLSIGQTAPEIKGRDLDDRELKLSDYRGKVVVVSFWASWCGPCMQLVPIERALATRMAGKPFAYIGVNGDAQKEDARHAVAKEHMTWRSLWNGGPHGPFSDAWNVRGWPTVYIIDTEGVIRLKFLGYGRETADLLNQAVDQLVSLHR